MKIITRGIIDWATLAVLEEEAYEYEGPLSECKSSGAAPQPVDPYTQAAAEYGLSTGTANYNARLNRTNQQNPLGSVRWDVTGSDNGQPQGPYGMGGSHAPPPAAGSGAASGMPAMSNPGSSPPSPPSSSWGTGGGGIFAGGAPVGGYTGGAAPPSNAGGGYGGAYPGLYGFGGGTSSAPIYTQTTELAPQFQSQLEKPLDTSGIAGMPGGPSTTQDLQNTRDSLYKQQMAFIDPEQKLASEQMDSKLANMGATIGSPAYNNEQDRLAREQEMTRGQARGQAIQAGGAEQSRLFGLGTQSLGNQITVRDQPIKEFQSLLGPQGGSVSALTPDISGAFNQQYQGQLAGYNAGVATDNANTQGIGGIIAAIAVAY